MAMMNAQQYRDSLAKRKPLKVYLDGKLLAKPLDHPYIRTSMNSVALTYELAHDPEHRQLMTVKSALTGETINRFCHLHQSTADLISKVRMQRLLGQRCGICVQRCVGLDALNAVFATTFDMDRKLHSPLIILRVKSMKRNIQGDFLRGVSPRFVVNSETSAGQQASLV